ncbi:MAG: murein hydrolase activator EnvC family protein [Sphingomonadaceae bacterium]
MVMGALLFASVADAQSIEQEREALVRAKAQAAAADRRAEALEQKAALEISEAEAAKAQAAAFASRIQSAESEISAAEARINLIEGLRAEQRARLRAKQEPAVRLVAALQMISRRPPALALVQPGSVTDLVHVRAILASVLPVLKARTAGLRAELEAGRRLRLDAEQALAALAESRSRLVTERAALVRLAAEHRRASDALTGSALVEQDRAVALGEQARDIVELMADINTGAETRERLAALGGPVLRPPSPADPRADPVDPVDTAQRGLPYRIPVVGTVVAGLGEVSDAGVRSRGLTFSTRAQAQVIAPATGRIAFAGPFRGFGQIVIIDHGRRWTTLVTSLATLDVQVGDNVVQGSPIGRAASERPTVTVELRRGNVPIDITPFVAG